MRPVAGGAAARRRAVLHHQVARQGRGDRLASAFELAAACGGRAFVESQEGAGARVTVYLRRRPSKARRSRPPTRGSTRRCTAAPSLLVEDDPLVRDHLASVFRELNYVVVEAWPMRSPPPARRRTPISTWLSPTSI